MAWNRSLAAYNRNPDITPRAPEETHLALDRTMQVISIAQNGHTQAMLSLFGVHATCIGSTNTLYDGDNKGRAAWHAERTLQGEGAASPVAIFAQATAGDVSPHFHGPGQSARRARITGEAEYAYAERNGAIQADRALAILHAAPHSTLDGPIDAIFQYADFTAITADPEFAGGRADAITSDPCHGAAFFGGTPVDGPGLPKPFLFLVRQIAAAIKRRRLRRLARYSPADRAYYERLYAAQGPKAIMQEAGRKIMLGQTLDRISTPDFVDPAVAEIKRQARIGAMRRQRHGADGAALADRHHRHARADLRARRIHDRGRRPSARQHGHMPAIQHFDRAALHLLQRLHGLRHQFRGISGAGL